MLLLGTALLDPLLLFRYDRQLQTRGLVLLLASKLHCTGCDVGTEGS